MNPNVRSKTADYRLFLLAIICIGFGGSMVDAIFNNFLDERFAITSFQRTFMEFPREVPGLLVIVASAAFFLACNRTLAVISQAMAAAGALLMGFFSSSFTVMMVWLFIYSLGQHLFFALNSDIGMELAEKGKTGKMLGKLSGIGNFAAIAGSFAVYLGFKHMGLDFKTTFIVTAAFLLAAALLMSFMRKNKPIPAKTRFTFKKKYRLYYILCVLHGARSYLLQVQNLAIARRRTKLARLQQKEGQASTRDVLEAEDSLRNAMNGLTSSLINYTTTRLEFLAGLGMIDVDMQGRITERKQSFGFERLQEQYPYLAVGAGIRDNGQAQDDGAEQDGGDE